MSTRVRAVVKRWVAPLVLTAVAIQQAAIGQPTRAGIVLLWVLGIVILDAVTALRAEVRDLHKLLDSKENEQ